MSALHVRYVSKADIVDRATGRLSRGLEATRAFGAMMG
jgi:hypothetical protein